MKLFPLNPSAAATVGYHCRERDRAEFAAVTGIPDRERLATFMGGMYGKLQGGVCGCTDDGVAVCVGAAVQPRPNCAGLLFYATDRFPEIALAVTRYVKRDFFPQLDRAGIHRIEAITSAAYPEMHRWLTVLGLEREGTLRGYGVNGEDFIMFARVRYAGTTCH